MARYITKDLPISINGKLNFANLKKRKFRGVIFKAYFEHYMFYDKPSQHIFHSTADPLLTKPF